MIAVPNTADRMLLKWMIILAIAAALTVAIWGQARGYEPMMGSEPQPLPAEAAKLARPMPLAAAPEEDPLPNPFAPMPEALLPIPLEGSVSDQVRQILLLHHNHHWQEAITGWNQLVPWAPGQEVWRQIALTQANLTVGNRESAELHLALARQLAPSHPVVEFYTGILRLEQARHAREWRNLEAPARTRWVSLDPVAPNTRSMYLLAAEASLTRCLELADTVNLDAPLVGIELLSAGETSPTVGELLAAIGADPFVGKAHNLLGRLVLDRSLADEAEKHFDAAHREGLSVAYGYQDIAKVYRREHRPRDAFRAELKQMQQGAGVIRPAQRAWKN